MIHEGMPYNSIQDQGHSLATLNTSDIDISKTVDTVYGQQSQILFM